MQLRGYRVHIPMPGVYEKGTCKGFLSIPTGEILVAKHQRDGDTLYVSVQWNTRELLVFPRDLAERTVECDVPPESAAYVVLGNSDGEGKRRAL